ncbi:MAG: hypothetical protein H0T46_24425 [Deltaproteobacteria bacterium]|nr:hypothetical protein [Deltaproteobacteria bacterium]
MDANRPWNARAVLAAALLLSIAIAWPRETPRTQRSPLTVAERALRHCAVIALGAHLDLIDARLADADLAIAVQELDPRTLGGDGCIPARGLGSCVY